MSFFLSLFLSNTRMKCNDICHTNLISPTANDVIAPFYMYIFRVFRISSWAPKFQIDFHFLSVSQHQKARRALTPNRKAHTRIEFLVRHRRRRLESSLFLSPRIHQRSRQLEADLPKCFVQENQCVSHCYYWYINVCRCRWQNINRNIRTRANHDNL